MLKFFTPHNLIKPLPVNRKSPDDIRRRMNQDWQLGAAEIVGEEKGRALVGVVACAAFAGHPVVQGEAFCG